MGEAGWAVSLTPVESVYVITSELMSPEVLAIPEPWTGYTLLPTIRFVW